MLSVLTINKKRHRKPSEVMDMIMVSQVYTYVQTHQIVYIKYLHFFVEQLYLSKAVKTKSQKKKKKLNHIRASGVTNSNMLSLARPYRSRL